MDGMKQPPKRWGALGGLAKPVQGADTEPVEVENLFCINPIMAPGMEWSGYNEDYVKGLK